VALQVDVYSLGVIMCQLFSGATPYAGMGMPAVLFAVVHKGQRPDVPPDMPHDYRDLMQRCWDNDMRQRCCTELRGHAFVHLLHTLLPCGARKACPVHHNKQSGVCMYCHGSCHQASRRTLVARGCCRPTVEEVIRELANQAKVVAAQAAAPPPQPVASTKRSSFSLRCAGAAACPCTVAGAAPAVLLAVLACTWATCNAAFKACCSDHQGIYIKYTARE
jgi:Protein tyrosine and serine/threonine kinase